MARRKNELTQEELLPEHKPVYAVDDMDSAIDLFLRDGRIRNISKYTLDFYRTELGIFKRMLERQGLDSAPSAITEHIMKENVILRMMDEGQKETSINCLLRAARALFNFLVREGHMQASPMRKMKLIRQKKKAVPTFTKQQVHILLAQPDTRTFIGVRDKTMLMLMLETGIRVRELTDVCLSDIEWKTGMILVAGKNGKDRALPFQATMRQQLAKYVQLRGKLEHDSLFVTIDNTPITRRQVQIQVALYGRRGGITGVRCSCHTLRHTFAKMSVQNKANIFALQAVLGHASLDQVRTYVSLFSSEVKDDHRKFSPLENL
ncbi:tyrosine-type recombinase/integrase [Paenibacillus sp. YN15]|uniref:tyrosine-type recombinase/integrase n=1 Tax=Paenibacillus sp. YN15 TaxID=1742774 RepID=UPI000DCDD5F5|nr:tyrosine-type recombinase/integrase [Paenibacillus sp. YN15]RAV03035.1 recombinase XerD [Paenibacillus sp. YN15]